MAFMTLAEYRKRFPNEPLGPPTYAGGSYRARRGRAADTQAQNGPYYQTPTGRSTSNTSFRAAAETQGAKDTAAMGAIGTIGAAAQNSLGQYGASRNNALASQSTAAANAYGQMANNWYNTMGQLGSIGAALSAAGLNAGSDAGMAFQGMRMGEGGDAGFGFIDPSGRVSVMGSFNQAGAGGSASPSRRQSSSFAIPASVGFGVTGPTGQPVMSGSAGALGGLGATSMGSASASGFPDQLRGTSMSFASRGASPDERVAMMNQGYGFLGSLYDTLRDTNQATLFGHKLGNELSANRGAMMDPGVMNSMRDRMNSSHKALSDLYRSTDMGFTRPMAARATR